MGESGQLSIFCGAFSPLSVMFLVHACVGSLLSLVSRSFGFCSFYLCITLSFCFVSIVSLCVSVRSVTPLISSSFRWQDLVSDKRTREIERRGEVKNQAEDEKGLFVLFSDKGREWKILSLFPLFSLCLPLLSLCFSPATLLSWLPWLHWWLWHLSSSISIGVGLLIISLVLGSSSLVLSLIHSLPPPSSLAFGNMRKIAQNTNQMKSGLIFCSSASCRLWLFSGSTWKHEHGSVSLFDYMVDQSGIEIDEETQHAIHSLIDPTDHPPKWVSHCQSQHSEGDFQKKERIIVPYVVSCSPFSPRFLLDCLSLCLPTSIPSESVSARANIQKGTWMDCKNDFQLSKRE